MLEGELRRMTDSRYFLYLVGNGEAIVEITPIQFQQLKEVLPVYNEIELTKS